MHTVTLSVIPTTPENSHSCNSLAALCGHPIAEWRQRGGIVELDFNDDWEPDAVARAALREAIELGQI